MDAHNKKPGEDGSETLQDAAAHASSQSADNVSIDTACKDPNEWILNIDVVSKTPNPAKLVFEIDQPEAPYALSDDPHVKCDVKTSPLPLTSHADIPASDETSGPSNDSVNQDIVIEGNKKRRRHSSDDDSSPTLPPAKTAKLDCKKTEEKKRHHVTFLFSPPFQNNETPKEAPAAQPNQAPAATGTSSASDDQPPPPSKRVQILPAAEPMWLAARRHRGAEQKAKLRADFNQHLLEQDTIPSHFLGGDKLPRYYIRDGSLPTSLKDLIVSQAREKTLHAIELLRDEQTREKRLADYYDGITADLYTQEDHPGLIEAQNLMASLLTHYRNVEKRRLDSLEKREVAKQPSSDEEYARALCKDPEAINAPSTSRGPGTNRRSRQARSPSPNRKRKSSAQPPTASKGKQGKPTPKPGPSKQRSKSPKPRGPERKGKSQANKGKGKEASTRKAGSSKPPVDPSGDLSEGAVRMLEALNEIGKIFKK